jgi:hypothetical protein
MMAITTKSSMSVNALRDKLGLMELSPHAARARNQTTAFPALAARLRKAQVHLPANYELDRRFLESIKYFLRVNKKHDSPIFATDERIGLAELRQKKRRFNQYR